MITFLDDDHTAQLYTFSLASACMTLVDRAIVGALNMARRVTQAAISKPYPYHIVSVHVINGTCIMYNKVDNQ